MLKPYLKPDHRALGSINSPMQCMMKEICAQCLQLHQDPVTGKESVVFSCFNQDQELDRVDFACLRQRLRQNGVQEKIGALWIDRSLTEDRRAITPSSTRGQRHERSAAVDDVASDVARPWLLIGSFLWRLLTPAHEYPGRFRRLEMAVAPW